MCVALNVIDGFDILAMTFGAPMIRHAWGLSAQQTGLLYSAALVGVMLGGLTLASLADFSGRRRVALICLSIGSAAMISSAGASGLVPLITLRLITGLAVGGMLPTINTIVAEHTAPRFRNTFIVLQAAGYPIGGVAGGLLAMQYGEAVGWQGLFLTGGLVSAALLPLAVFIIPESLEGFTDGSCNIERRSAVVGRPGAPVDGGLGSQRTARRVGFAALRTRTLIMATALFCIATFMVQFSFYFVISWIPTLMSGVGTAVAVGISGATLMNVGGAVGDVVLAIVCTRYHPRYLGAAAMALCFSNIVLLGFAPVEGGMRLLLAWTSGCFLFVSMASVYALAPKVFPSAARSTGTGLALSVGRIGGALGPWVGGMVIGKGQLFVPVSAAALAAPLLIAAVIIVCLRIND
jgi:MFS family permease